MSDLRRFFHPAPSLSSADMPTVSGTLLSTVNDEIEAELKSTKKRVKWTSKQKAEIGRYARLYGCPQAVKHFSTSYPKLTRQTARNFKKLYADMIIQGEATPGTIDETVVIAEIKSKRMGRPSLLPDGAIDDSIAILEALRLKGAIIKGTVIRGIVRGVLRCSYPEKSLTYTVDYETSRQMIYQMETRKQIKLVRRKGTTAKLPIPPGVFSEVKLSFQRSINTIVTKHKIPPALIINHDQTPITYVSQSSRTLAKKGSKIVAIAESKDKRQITGNLAVSLDGSVLPFQIIYKGKTKRCLPKKTKFPEGFHITMTPTHWSNETTSIEYFEKILDPYFVKKRKDLNLPEDQKCLVISDVFTGQQTGAVEVLYQSKNVIIVKVPANMTHLFQPLDVSINGLVKSHLRDKFESWYAESIVAQLTRGISPDHITIDCTLGAIKELHATWIISVYNFLHTRKEDIFTGFRKSGITEASAPDFLNNENPYWDLVEEDVQLGV